MCPTNTSTVEWLCFYCTSGTIAPQGWAGIVAQIKYCAQRRVTKLEGQIRLVCFALTFLAIKLVAPKANALLYGAV